MNSHGGFGCYIKCLLVLHWHHKNSLRCFFVHLSCCISNSNGLSGTAISFSESLSQAGIGDDTSSSLKVCFLVITLYVGVRQSSSLHWKRWLFCYRNPFSICFSSPLLPSLCCPCGLSFVWGRLKGSWIPFPCFPFENTIVITMSSWNRCYILLITFHLKASKSFWGQPTLRRRDSWGTFHMRRQ